jgi:hypothetical protein
MREGSLVGFVIGALAAALGGIIAWRYISRHPVGGGQPLQNWTESPTNLITPQVPGRTDALAAPVSQNTPITEAAYNQGPLDQFPAFGREANRTNQEVILPW